jgi:PAS domain S-box-containing protein
MLMNATARRDANNNIVGVVGVGQDITERKKAQLELERVAQDLRTLIDTANAPIFGIDSNGNVNEWNNKVAEITGFDKMEVLNHNLVEEFIHSDYKPMVKHVLENALQGKETANFEFPLFTKDQERVDILLNCASRRAAKGKIVGVVGVGQDITERKKVQSELERVALDLRMLIDTANAPIFGIDEKGNVNEWNNMAHDITKYTKEEVIGKNLVEEFITQAYKKSVKKVLDNALRGVVTPNFEFPLFTKDQERVEMLMNATARRDANNNIVGVVGVGQDITERKKAQLELERVAQDLRALIDTANAPIFGIDNNG